MSHSVSWLPHGCYITYAERVTFDEFMGAILAIHAHENYDIAIYVIHDMTTVAEYDFSTVDMTKIVAHELGARFTNPNVRPAVVSTNLAMGAMTRAFSDITKLEVKLFSSILEATNWAKGVLVPA